MGTAKRWEVVASALGTGRPAAQVAALAKQRHAVGATAGAGAAAAAAAGPRGGGAASDFERFLEARGRADVKPDAVTTRDDGGGGGGGAPGGAAAAAAADADDDDDEAAAEAARDLALVAAVKRHPRGGAGAGGAVAAGAGAVAGAEGARWDAIARDAGHGLDGAAAKARVAELRARAAAAAAKR